LLKLKDKIMNDLEEVSMEIGYGSISFEYLEKYTKEALENYPRHTMALNKCSKNKKKEKRLN
jgi:hypothetical protein